VIGEGQTLADHASTRRWAWAQIDLDAIAHNVRVLRAAVAPSEMWAIVKADGYGHGAAPVAEAALAAGAAGLGVALVQEGAELRRAGIDAPILVLSQQPPEQVADLVAHRLIATVYTPEYADLLPAGYPAHVKVDTGMQRVGADPHDVAKLLAHTHLDVQGIFTHLACADEPRLPATAEQLELFEAVLARLDRRPARVHAANSAGALAHPAARYDLVRVGIAMYGISPGPGVDHLVGDLVPALELHARVSFVKRVAAGTHVSYGWRHTFDAATTIATVPIGYADGVPRRLGTLADRPGADVLIAGRRCPIVGVVTMDQLMVDVGDLEVVAGDEVVLLGRQCDHQIRAEDWADRLGTIGYEIVCAISKRVPRAYAP
jgi:alanine racemase